MYVCLAFVQSISDVDDLFHRDCVTRECIYICLAFVQSKSDVDGLFHRDCVTRACMYACAAFASSCDFPFIYVPDFAIKYKQRLFYSSIITRMY